MAKSLYITTSDKNSGKSLVSLGIMNMLLRKIPRVAYFRPIIADQIEGHHDQHIDLILKHFHLDAKYEQAFVFEEKAANDLISNGKTLELVEKVLLKFKELEEHYDFVLIEGKTISGISGAIEADINAMLAKNLGSPVLLVTNAYKKSMDETLKSVKITAEAFVEKKCDLLGVIVNRLDPNLKQEISSVAKQVLGKKVPCFYSIPFYQKLNGPTVKEIAQALDASILFGARHMQRQATDFIIAAANLPVFLDFLMEGGLVITPGDRMDILLASILARQSARCAQPAGVVLTLGLIPTNTTMNLIKGLPEVLPILTTKANTFETVSKLNAMSSAILPEFPEKIELALQTFEDNVNFEELGDRIVKTKLSTMTPKMFEYSLVKKAKKNKRRIVLAEGEDDRILKAADILLKKSVVDITILGNVADIHRRAQEMGLDLEKAQLLDPHSTNKIDEYSKILYDLRKDKGMSEVVARDLMNDVSYFGTMMVHTGEAHGMVSGAAHTTQHTIRPALQFIKTVPGCSIVSSVFFMCLEDRVLVYGDCAVNPMPTAEQLAEIAIASARTAISFGIEAKVAMLSYSSGSSGQGEEVEKVRNATEIVRKRWPELLIEGPIQYDAAVDMETGRKKMPGSKVAGQASVLIFPDLNTGNNTYKAVQRETGGLAIGPVLQGLNRPVNDLSRGCTVADVVNTVIITAIQSL